MEKLVVIGSDTGGISAFCEPKRLAGDRHETLLVSDSKSFKFTHCHPWVAFLALKLIGAASLRGDG